MNAAGLHAFRREASGHPHTMPEDEELIREEEEAAAAEARRIGGRSGMEDMDEAERAAAEHGGGEAEGFEEAEELLEEQASHGDPAVNPLSDMSEPEAEEEPGTFAEPDEVESTETEEDTEGTRFEE
jgi:hypothetical protein